MKIKLIEKARVFIDYVKLSIKFRRKPMHIDDDTELKEKVLKERREELVAWCREYADCMGFSEFEKDEYMTYINEFYGQCDFAI